MDDVKTGLLEKEEIVLDYSFDLGYIPDKSPLLALIAEDFHLYHFLFLEYSSSSQI